jgi:hypothetical protein
MTAFASASDLEARLGRTFSSPEEEQVTVLLEDAAALMRGVMRNQVYPATQATYVAYPSGGRVDLPQDFVVSVDAVEREGVEIEYTRREDSVIVDCDEAVDITFTYGLDAAPADLVGINCAIVSNALLTTGAGLGLTAGGLSSVAIDDFRAAFADGGSSAGMTITPHLREYLVSRYGRAAWVVDTK